LVNRGGRELPIAPQITAADITLEHSQNLQLLQNTDGHLSLELKSLTLQPSSGSTQA
jgi:pyrimidine operon attenuation protein/uracil phosphoribosyltransferase